MSKMTKDLREISDNCRSVAQACKDLNDMDTYNRLFELGQAYEWMSLLSQRLDAIDPS